MLVYDDPLLARGEGSTAGSRIRLASPGASLGRDYVVAGDGVERRYPVEARGTYRVAVRSQSPDGQGGGRCGTARSTARPR